MAVSCSEGWNGRGAPETDLSFATSLCVYFEVQHVPPVLHTVAHSPVNTPHQYVTDTVHMNRLSRR
jgi:hypothetical protein